VRIALLSSCPDKRLESHIRRQGCVERVHHVNILVEQHVTASKSSRDLSYRRELGAVYGISVLGKKTVTERQEVKRTSSVYLAMQRPQMPEKRQPP